MTSHAFTETQLVEQPAVLSFGAALVRPIRVGREAGSFLFEYQELFPFHQACRTPLGWLHAFAGLFPRDAGTGVRPRCGRAESPREFVQRVAAQLTGANLAP